MAKFYRESPGIFLEKEVIESQNSLGWKDHPVPTPLWDAGLPLTSSGSPENVLKSLSEIGAFGSKVLAMKRLL